MDFRSSCYTDSLKRRIRILDGSVSGVINSILLVEYEIYVFTNICLWHVRMSFLVGKSSPIDALLSTGHNRSGSRRVRDLTGWTSGLPVGLCVTRSRNFRPNKSVYVGNALPSAVRWFDSRAHDQSVTASRFRKNRVFVVVRDRSRQLETSVRAPELFRDTMFPAWPRRLNVHARKSKKYWLQYVREIRFTEKRRWQLNENWTRTDFDRSSVNVFDRNLSYRHYDRTLRRWHSDCAHDVRQQ